MRIIALKETASEISPILSLLQQSLDTHEVPNDWKEANIVPIFKKGDRTKPSNYRPVSLTAVASKILEHIVVFAIMNHQDTTTSYMKISTDSELEDRVKHNYSYRPTTLRILRFITNQGLHVDVAILD